MRLQHKVTLITGSRGESARAIALRFAQEGAIIILNVGEDCSIVDEIKAMGRDALTLTADVRVEEQVKQMVETALHAFGRSEEQVLSLFEPHTRVIPRQKGGAEVEFGRLVTLDEVEAGIMTRFEILEQPSEQGQAEKALAHHQHLFGQPPRILAGDRGVRLRVPLPEDHPLMLTWQHWWWSYERPKPAPALRLILIWDNLAGHLSYNMVRWLLQHGILPLYTPLSGSWLNMAESVQRFIVRRALSGQHPQSAQQVIDWLEQTVAGWNKQPTPFIWNGKRRRRRERARLRRLGGSGAAVLHGYSIAN